MVKDTLAVQQNVGLTTLIRFFSLFLFLLFGLAACAPAQNAAIELPLAADKLTFLFFYTDE